MARFNGDFEDGIATLKIGAWADGLYPVRAVGAGFLRIKCRHSATSPGGSSCPVAGWPSGALGRSSSRWSTRSTATVYLGEDYSFIRRCRQAGLQPVVDTSFRLWHIGDYAYGVEGPPASPSRSRKIMYHIDLKEAGPITRRFP